MTHEYAVEKWQEPESGWLLIVWEPVLRPGHWVDKLRTLAAASGTSDSASYTPTSRGNSSILEKTGRGPILHFKILIYSRAP